MGATAGCPRYRIPRERCPLCRVPATFRCIRFRERRVAVALFRERALLHCMACCAANGVSPRPCSARAVSALPYSANGYYCIAQPYCAANGDVILSRRACGVSKNLLRLPQSDYNATMPMLRPPLSFRPKRGVKRRAERRNLSHCTHAFAMNICPCSIPSPYCNPARSFGFVPRYSLVTSLRMTGGQRGCPRCRVPRKCVTTLQSLLRGQPRCHSEPPRMRRVEEYTRPPKRYCN